MPKISFEIEVSERDVGEASVLVLDLSGQLETSTVPNLQKEATDLIEQGNKYMVLALSGGAHRRARPCTTLPNGATPPHR